MLLTTPFIVPKRQIQRVFIHCSASDHPEHADIAVIKEWHLARGFSDVGYHFFIKFDGTVQRGRNIEVAPAAQKDNNAHTIAICCAGLSAFTEAQFASLRTLSRTILVALPHVTFHGHCEVSTKTCPVFDYPAVLGLDAAGRMHI